MKVRQSEVQGHLLLQREKAPVTRQKRKWKRRRKEREKEGGRKKEMKQYKTKAHTSDYVISQWRMGRNGYICDSVSQPVRTSC